MKLKKCPSHPDILYTLEDLCPKCKKPAKGAHYKFIKTGDAEKLPSD